ncbi:MAG: DUF4169 family protein [Novosphingobium sp.]
MAEIVNLRLARKAKARAGSAAKAAANRAKFGQTKAERELRKTEAARQASVLDGIRREPDE